jgi:uncharacterized protein DUF4340
MKKSTGIIFLVAAALAAFVYFYDMKHNAPSSETPADTSKPAFSVSSDDVTGMQLDRAGASAVFVRQNDGWYITQPLAARGDQSALDGITTQLSALRVDRTLTATPDQLASFGLSKPAVRLDFTLKSGAKHTLQLGAKDFSGSSVYAIVDDSKSVALISNAILTSSDKPLDDFRDHSVLTLDTNSVTSFDLKNAAGEISAVKNGADWKIEKPRAVATDSDAISSLLGAVSSARISSFVSDPRTDLAKYGLGKPAITFNAKLSTGKTAELQIGKKEDSDYDARDPSRPTIFRVNDTLFKSLSEKLFDLRDKQVIHIAMTDITRAQMKNEKGTTACVQSTSGDLVLEQPAGAKGTPPECPGFVDSLEGARAQDIYDAPSAMIAASMAKAPIVIAITDKSGKSIEVRVSAVSGDAVYARTSVGPEIYKLDKQLFTDLDIAPPKQ